MKISKKVVAKAVAIVCIIALVYLNIQLIDFYANSAEYTLRTIFGEEPIAPDTLTMITFVCGGLGIVGVAVS